MNNPHLISTQLDISGGNRRDRSDFLLDAEFHISPPILQKRGSLYLITEIEYGNRDNQSELTESVMLEDLEFCRTAQLAIMEEYYEYNSSASVTSALRHALELVNQQLYNINSAKQPLERRGIGLTVALVKGKELYLAQVQPSLALVVHACQLVTHPKISDFSSVLSSSSPPLTSKEFGQTQPLPPLDHLQRLHHTHSLGRYPNLEIIFNRSFFQDGDLFILCSSNFAQYLDSDKLQQLVANSNNVEALLNISEFAGLCQIRDWRGMAVSLREDYPLKRPILPASGAFLGEKEVSGSLKSFSLSDNTPEIKPAGYTFEDNSTVKRTFSRKEKAQTDSSFPKDLYSNTSSGIEPALRADLPKDSWIRLEDDNLNQPPYFRGNPEAASSPPILPAQPVQSREPNSQGYAPPSKRESLLPSSSKSGDYESGGGINQGNLSSSNDLLSEAWRDGSGSLPERKGKTGQQPSKG